MYLESDPLSYTEVKTSRRNSLSLPLRRVKLINLCNAKCRYTLTDKDQPSKHIMIKTNECKRENHDLKQIWFFWQKVAKLSKPFLFWKKQKLVVNENWSRHQSFIKVWLDHLKKRLWSTSFRKNGSGSQLRTRKD